jgi:hypothetical protein
LIGHDLRREDHLGATPSSLHRIARRAHHPRVRWSRRLWSPDLLEQGLHILQRMEWYAYSPHEELGVQFVQRLVDRLRASDLAYPRSPVPPEGPHFVYEANSALFFGRTGRGPLRIAWDTNLLLDYFECGRVLWEGESVPDTLSPEHAEQLEALQIVMGVWVLRDVRFHILPGVVSDSRRKRLSPERRAQRLRAWREFSRALTLLTDGTRDEEIVAPMPVSAAREVLASVPPGNDRQLVEAAVNRGLHVFMTCDKRVIKAKRDLAAFGLLIASPQDLIEQLAAAGALECLFYPEQISWPFPDLQRVTHLMHALA